MMVVVLLRILHRSLPLNYAILSTHREAFFSWSFVPIIEESFYFLSVFFIDTFELCVLDAPAGVDILFPLFVD